jgi:hypothetical protein
MEKRSHWRSILVVVIIIVIISSTLVILSQPIQAKGVVYGLLDYNAKIGPSNNSSYNYIGMIVITNSSDANLFSGSVTSNSSLFSVYLLTKDQFVIWSEGNLNVSANLKENNLGGNLSNGTLSGASIVTSINTLPVDYSYGITGNGTLHLSWRISSGTEYAIVILSHTRLFSYEPRLTFYYQYLQI